ncbi:hypothetical protein Val02_70140 [Virgisporangium aliadipatigenens]|uniref:Uncharacterized protein n=1 Tax=Virgisporangium aliadipatigenens TaxID=741659 RepID=A0A8J4DUJ9_9ACTN|nr:hypothetical protein Val02_70140 [Virgisporangium aliadipatigenens]
MLSYEIQRPAGLLAVCAPVSLSPLAGAPTAHGSVGYGAVRTAPEGTLAAAQWLTVRQEAKVQGTSGFVAKPRVDVMDPVGGVRGKPPRGRSSV